MRVHLPSHLSVIPNYRDGRDTRSGSGDPELRSRFRTTEMGRIRLPLGGSSLTQCLPVFAREPRRDTYQNGVMKLPQVK